MKAILHEETKPSSSQQPPSQATETIKKFFPGYGDDYFALILTTLALLTLLTLELTLETGGPLSHFIALPLKEYFQERTLNLQVSKRSKLAIFLLFILSLLDFINLWIRITVVAGWVVPRKYIYIVYPYLFPMPNFRVSTDMLSQGGGGGGGSGGYGINVFPLISGKVIGWLQEWIKEGIAFAVSKCGGGEKVKTKKKKKKKIYEDDSD